MSLNLGNIVFKPTEQYHLNDITLNFEPGKMYTILGRTLSGKTTLLKTIAGLQTPDSGNIQFEGKDFLAIPVWERNVAMVYQQFINYPHLNVQQNIEFPLKQRKMDPNLIEKEVTDAIQKVGLKGFEARKIQELSGGQQQRVALARSLINKPKILLLDEPLGALDLKLREQMQIELKNLQRQFQITFIYVTHDQQEALSMSDRIAIFNDGKIEQVDTPDNIYKNPKTAFVADFIGTTSLVSKQLAAELFNYNSAFSIRPENIKINNEQDSKSEFNAKVVVTDIQFQGSYYKILCKANDLTLTALHYVDTQNTFKINLGDNLELSWDKIDITNIND